MADKYLEKGVSAGSGLFSGVYGVDLVLQNHQLIGSLGDPWAPILGIVLVLLATSTIKASLFDAIFNKE
ncbi:MULTISPECIES: hypothetical protein [unclassified Haloarcula]|uniref:hypothetical protein n=1 Tax=unclassified Haloarcula TaxID=2624677 RepID=UPI0012447FB5|nr:MULTISPECIES: hypothetical protein [unclassified Haloarcula]